MRFSNGYYNTVGYNIYYFIRRKEQYLKRLSKQITASASLLLNKGKRP